MQKTSLPPAMYHGANSFAKETYRDTTHAGFGCNSSVPHNYRASNYGGWRSHAPRENRLHSPRMHQVAVACGPAQLKKEQCQGYSALQCSP